MALTKTTEQSTRRAFMGLPRRSRGVGGPPTPQSNRPQATATSNDRGENQWRPAAPVRHVQRISTCAAATGAGIIRAPSELASWRNR